MLNKHNTRLLSLALFVAVAFSSVATQASPVLQEKNKTDKNPKTQTTGVIVQGGKTAGKGGEKKGETRGIIINSGEKKGEANGIIINKGNTKANTGVIAPIDKKISTGVVAPIDKKASTGILTPRDSKASTTGAIAPMYDKGAAKAKGKAKP